MKGKEYLHKKLRYIKKLSILILVVNLVYFNLKFGFNDLGLDTNTVFIIYLGINLLSASFITSHAKYMIKSVR